MGKQSRITLETSSLLVLQAQTAERVWCAQCCAETEAIALDRIGVISNVDHDALDEWLNSENVHRLTSPNGSPVICLNSLLAWIQTTTRGFPPSRAMRKEDQ
jgi:hypothetical protein